MGYNVKPRQWVYKGLVGEIKGIHKIIVLFSPFFYLVLRIEPRALHMGLSFKEN
jgi:hypothetical protein